MTGFAVSMLWLAVGLWLATLWCRRRPARTSGDRLFALGLIVAGPAAVAAVAAIVLATAAGRLVIRSVRWAWRKTGSEDGDHPP